MQERQRISMYPGDPRFRSAAIKLRDLRKRHSEEVIFLHYVSLFFGECFDKITNFSIKLVRFEQRFGIGRGLTPIGELLLDIAHAEPMNEGRLGGEVEDAREFVSARLRTSAVIFGRALRAQLVRRLQRPHLPIRTAAQTG